MPLAAKTVPVAHDFEVHLEPARISPRLFLMQGTARVSPASSLVPKELRELILSQKISVSFEKDLADFLDKSAELPLHVHTPEGVLRMLWDPSAQAGSKTELDLVGGRVRVQRLVCEKNRPDGALRRFVRVGERMIGDIDGARLFRLSDASGWVSADLLQEAVMAADIPAPDPNELVYEVDPDAEPPVLTAERTRRSDRFELSEPFEAASELVNDRKVIYPSGQRSSYLKDLLLKVEGQPVEAVEGELSFRVTMQRKTGAPEMTLKGGCFWDGRWFDLGSGFFRYFEHLNSMREPALRR